MFLFAELEKASRLQDLFKSARPEPKARAGGGPDAGGGGPAAATAEQGPGGVPDVGTLDHIFGRFTDHEGEVAQAVEEQPHQAHAEGHGAAHQQPELGAVLAVAGAGTLAGVVGQTASSVMGAFGPKKRSDGDKDGAGPDVHEEQDQIQRQRRAQTGGGGAPDEGGAKHLTQSPDHAPPAAPDLEFAHEGAHVGDKALNDESVARNRKRDHGEGPFGAIGTDEEALLRKRGGGGGAFGTDETALRDEVAHGAPFEHAGVREELSAATAATVEGAAAATPAHAGATPPRKEAVPKAAYPAAHHEAAHAHHPQPGPTTMSHEAAHARHPAPTPKVAPPKMHNEATHARRAAPAASEGFGTDEEALVAKAKNGKPDPKLALELSPADAAKAKLPAAPVAPAAPALSAEHAAKRAPTKEAAGAHAHDDHEAHGPVPAAPMAHPAPTGHAPATAHAAGPAKATPAGTAAAQRPAGAPVKTPTAPGPARAHQVATAATHGAQQQMVAHVGEAYADAEHGDVNVDDIDGGEEVDPGIHEMAPQYASHHGGGGGGGGKHHGAGAAKREPMSEAQQRLQELQARADWRKEDVLHKHVAKAQQIGDQGAQKKEAAIQKADAKAQAAKQAAQQKQTQAKEQVKQQQDHQAHSIEELRADVTQGAQKEKQELTVGLTTSIADATQKLTLEKQKLQQGATTQAMTLQAQTVAKEATIRADIAQKKQAQTEQMKQQTELIRSQGELEKQKITQTGEQQAQNAGKTAEEQATQIEQKGEDEAKRAIDSSNDQAAKARSDGRTQAAKARSDARAKADSIKAQEAKDSDSPMGKIKKWFGIGGGSSAIEEGDIRAEQITEAAEEKAQQILDKGKDTSGKVKGQAEKSAEAMRGQGKKQGEELKAKAVASNVLVDNKVIASITQQGQTMANSATQMEASATKAVADAKVAADKAKADSDIKVQQESAKIDAELAKTITKLNADFQKQMKAVDTKAEATLKRLATAKDSDLKRMQKMVDSALKDIDKSSDTLEKQSHQVIAHAQKKVGDEVKKQLVVIAAQGQKAVAKIDAAFKAASAQITATAQATEKQLSLDARQGLSAVEKEGETQRNDIELEGKKRGLMLEAMGKGAQDGLTKTVDGSIQAMEGMREDLKKDCERILVKDVLAEKAMAEKAAKDLEDAMDGWGTDEDAIYKALKGKTPEEIKAIKSAYKKKYGKDLAGELEGEMSGTELKEAKAWMSGDPVLGAAAAIENAQGGFLGIGSDPQKIKDTLKEVPKEYKDNPALFREKLTKEFEDQTGKRLQTAIKEELRGDNMEEAQALASQFQKKEPPKPPDDQLKKVDPAGVRQTCADLRKAMDGPGTDEDAVFAALKGKTAAEVYLIKQQYKEHYGRDLDDALESEMSGTELKEAKSALSGDPVLAAVASLQNAADGVGTDEKKIHDTLEQIEDPEMRRKVAEQYERHTGVKLKDMIADEMGSVFGGKSNDEDLGLVLLQETDPKERRAKSAAIRLDEAADGGFLGTGAGTDEDVIYDTLEKAKTPAERKRIADAYKARTGKDLTAMLKAELSGPELDVADAYMVGDVTKASAARMKVAAEDTFGTDEKAIFKQLQGKSKEEREAIIAAYNKQYGKEMSFEAMLKDEMSGMDLEKAQMLAQDGKLPVAFELEYAMDGIGTDEDAIKELLKGKNAKEIEEIKQAYRDRYHKDLTTELGGEMSGRDEFDVGLLLEGEPQTPAEKIARAKKIYEHERGNGIANSFTDAFYDSGADLDKSYQDVLKMEAELAKAGVVAYDEHGKIIDTGKKLDEAQQGKMEAKYDWLNLDQKNFQAAKDSMTDAMAQVGAVVAGAVVTIATAGTAGPAVVACLAALASGATSMAIKGMMKGADYGIEDIGIDAAKTLMQAALAGAGKADLIVGLVQKAGPILGPVVQGGVQGMLGAMVDAGFDEQASRDFGDWMKNMVTAGGKGLVGGAASSFVGSMIPAPGKEPATWQQALLRGMATGGVNSMVPLAIDPATWEGRFEDIAKKFGIEIAKGAIQSGADEVGTFRGAAFNAGRVAANKAAAEGKSAPEIEHARAAAHAEVLNARAEALKAQRGPSAPETVEAKSHAEDGKTSLDQTTAAPIHSAETGAPVPAAQHDVDTPSAHPTDTETPHGHATDTDEGPHGHATDTDEGPHGHATDTEAEIAAAKKEQAEKDALPHPGDTAARAEVMEAAAEGHAGAAKDAETLRALMEQASSGDATGIKALEERLALMSHDERSASTMEAAAETSQGSESATRAAEAEALRQNPPTPEQLAEANQRIANAERDARLAPKQEVIDQIAALKKTARSSEDWERIRQLEHDHNLPTSMRTSHHDEQAALGVMADDADFGKHADGTPVTREEHLAELAELHTEVKPKLDDKTAGHLDAVESLQAHVDHQIFARDLELMDQVMAAIESQAPTVAPDGTPRIELDMGGSASLGMGGAGAAGAGVDPTGRIGIENADKPELWGTLGHKPAGQEAANIKYGKGGIETADVAEHPTAQTARSSELALHVAAQRLASGVPTLGVEGHVGTLEFRTHPETGMPQVGVPVKIPDVEMPVIIWKDQVDITSGMGPARELRKEQITPEHAAALKGTSPETSQLLSGESALALPAESFQGQDVLGIGGGPTSIWAMEHAQSGGANAEVVGNMSRPDKDSVLGKKLAEVEKAIQKARADRKTPEQYRELTDQFRGIIGEHVSIKMERMVEIDADLGRADIDPITREKLETERTRLKNEVDPFMGSRVDRNEGVLNSEKVTKMVMDVMKVEPITSGDDSGKVKVVFADGSERVYDRVIPSIGQEPNLPGGINQMLERMPPEMTLKPVIADGRVVGLESVPPGITLSGAAMTGTVGTNMAAGLLARIPPEMRDAVIASLVDHANREGVSHGSKGIVPGIENVGQNPAAMQEALKHLTPEQRDAVLRDFLGAHSASRSSDFEGAPRFDPVAVLKVHEVQPGDTIPSTTGGPRNYHDPLQVMDIGLGGLRVAPTIGPLPEGHIRAADAAQIRGALAEMASTDAGRDALRRIDQAGGKVVINPGGGTYYDQSSGTIFLDPVNTPDLPGVLTHEAHHLATMADLPTAGESMPKEFLEGRMQNEAEAETQKILHNKEKGGPMVEREWRAQAEAKLAEIEKDLRAKVPGKTDEEYKSTARQLLNQGQYDSQAALAFQLAYDEAMEVIKSSAGGQSMTAADMEQEARSHATAVLERGWGQRQPNTPDSLNYQDNTLLKYINANPEWAKALVGRDPVIDEWIARNPEQAAELGLDS